MKLLPKVFTVCLIAAGLHLCLFFSGAIPFFDYRIFDLLTSSRVAPFSPASSSTIVVEIDEESLQQLGQWPWPRILLAKVLQEILVQKPAAVGLDIFFPEPDRTSPAQIKKFYRQRLGLDVELRGFPAELTDHDQIFADVLRSGPTVLPVFAGQTINGQARCDLSASQLSALAESLQIPESDGVLCNTPVLQQASSGFGFLNASVDSDGVFRRQPLILGFNQQVIPSLALAMLAQVDPALEISQLNNTWQPLSISVMGQRATLNSRGELLNLLYPQAAFSRISIAQVISGAVRPDLFTGKLVLVGSSAAGLYDQYMTAKGEILPGVFIHAALLENLLHGKGIYQPNSAKNVAILFSGLISLLIVWLVFDRRYLLSWGVYLGVSMLAVVTAWLMLERGVYLSLGYFLTPFSFHFFIISLFFAVLHYVERKHFLEDLGAAHSATIDSMTMVVESRDVETGAHIIRTKEYIKLLAEALVRKGYYARYLTPQKIDLLYRAAPLHDIGKVGIPDAILQKPGKLDEKELEIMHSHVAIGRTIIENAINSYNKTNEFLTIASNISYSHHEKWDGSGYPLGLHGAEIPLEGRLMALADVYDALISRRCYKEPFTFQEAERIIIRERGRHFDPVIIEEFIALQQEFREIAQRYQESNGTDVQLCPLPGKRQLV